MVDLTFTEALMPRVRSEIIKALTASQVTGQRSAEVRARSTPPPTTLRVWTITMAMDKVRWPVQYRVLADIIPTLHLQLGLLPVSTDISLQTLRDIQQLQLTSAHPSMESNDYYNIMLLLMWFVVF